MNVILFGATGMVGQGVLRECLRDEAIDSILAIGRTPTGQSHRKLSEVVRIDMFDFEVNDADFQGYNACFFCLGVSSAGMNESVYTRMSYDLTLGWANRLAKINSAIRFIYVSGAGTGGRAMWAQVKGRTENALLELFPNAYMFRIGALRAIHGETSKTRWTRILYAGFRPLWPLVQLIAPKTVITTEELGRAMIHVARDGARKRVLENSDLLTLAGANKGRHSMAPHVH